MVDKNKKIQILGLAFYQSNEYFIFLCEPNCLEKPFSPNYLFFGPINHKDLKQEKALSQKKKFRWAQYIKILLPPSHKRCHIYGMTRDFKLFLYVLGGKRKYNIYIIVRDIFSKN